MDSSLQPTSLISNWAQEELRQVELQNPAATAFVNQLEDRLAQDLERALTIAYDAAHAKPPSERMMEESLGNPALLAVARQAFKNEVGRLELPPVKGAHAREAETKTMLAELGACLFGASHSAEVDPDHAIDPHTFGKIAHMHGVLHDALHMSTGEHATMNMVRLPDADKDKEESMVKLLQKRGAGFTQQQMREFEKMKKEGE